MREGPGYTAYPAELEKQTIPKISRVGVTLVCEHLVTMGILQSEKKRSPTHSKTTAHYGLQEDGETFIKLTKNYFRTLAKSDPYSWQSSAMWSFMTSQYARRQINSNLIRDILSSKKVEMPFFIKMGKKIKKQKVDSKHFLGDSILLSFPVMPPGTTIEEMSPKVIIHNDTLTEDQKEYIPKIIENHYRDVEEKTLILPILALLQISPGALRHFLSYWKPYVRDGSVLSFHSTSQGFEMIEHVLFRLVWNTINDISLTRSIPEMGNVSIAYVSGGNYHTGKPSPLLLLRCMDGLSFEYEAGFDTDHIYYGDGADIVEIDTNPENCTVKIVCRKESAST